MLLISMFSIQCVTELQRLFLIQNSINSLSYANANPQLEQDNNTQPLMAPWAKCKTTG